MNISKYKITSLVIGVELLVELIVLILLIVNGLESENITLLFCILPIKSLVMVLGFLIILFDTFFLGILGLIITICMPVAMTVEHIRLRYRKMDAIIILLIYYIFDLGFLIFYSVGLVYTQPYPIYLAISAWVSAAIDIFLLTMLTICLYDWIRNRRKSVQNNKDCTQ